MATKKETSIFDVESTASSREKKPTFLQFLKGLRHDEAGLVYQVQIIWLPGKFSNITLQTTHFRLSINETHPLYEGLRSQVDTFTKGNRGMQVELMDIKRKTFKLTVSEAVGDWFFIGDVGLRWQGENEDDIPF